MRTLVIAEPGCTAQGDLATMLRQIDMVVAAGANVFKGQWTSSAEKMAARRHASTYQRFYRWLEWPVEWHEQLRARCALRGIEYMSTVYLPEDVATIAPFVSRFKISSFEAMDPECLRANAAHGKPVIISTGLTVDRSVWPSAMALWVLQCTSAYPAPVETLNLSVLRGQEYDGLSDHSDPSFTWVGALAVAAGASIVETHVRLDDCHPQNPDYAVARNPRQLEDYIRHIRFAEAALGDGVKKLEPAELAMLRYRVKSQGGA